MRHAVFRVDGAPFMGIGHVMRCLTLARALRDTGWECRFILRDFSGHFGSAIERAGFALHLLPFCDVKAPRVDAGFSPPHAQWLGVSQDQDARESAEAFGDQAADLLVVDHYGIDARWHRELRPLARQIMVIDDLADRDLECDILLDQTFQRDPGDYERLVPPECRRLCGSDYMLLRPEFAALRAQALEKRAAFKDPVARRIFICMGSGDPDNLTCTILQGLSAIIEPRLEIAVVISSKAPHLNAIRKQAADSGHHVRILEDCDDVPAEMLKADIAFGAGGTMSWERCCLGLPTFLAVIAENQRMIARNLAQAGAVFDLGWKDEITPELIAQTMAAITPKALRNAAQTCAGICDGKGTARVLDILTL